MIDAKAQKRFWDKVDRDGPGGCWLWTGALFGNGYALIMMNSVRKRGHRVSYEWAVGPIPEGAVLDHICRVRHCVNPVHLRPLSNVENIMCGEGISARNARKTHCIRGHELTGDNLYAGVNRRTCRACNRAKYHRYIQNKRARLGEKA